MNIYNIVNQLNILPDFVICVDNMSHINFYSIIDPPDLSHQTI